MTATTCVVATEVVVAVESFARFLHGTRRRLSERRVHLDDLPRCELSWHAPAVFLFDSS